MKEVGKTLLLSILAGILICIGCCVNLLLINDNKYLGAFLFSAGLFFYFKSFNEQQNLQLHRNMASFG